MEEKLTFFYRIVFGTLFQSADAEHNHTEKSESL